MLSGLLSQINVYICFSIYFITGFGGFYNDDSSYISLGSPNGFKYNCNLDIMRQTVCIVFNPIIAESFVAFFSCTAVFKSQTQ